MKIVQYKNIITVSRAYEQQMSLSPARKNQPVSLAPTGGGIAGEITPAMAAMLDIFKKTNQFKSYKPFLGVCLVAIFLFLSVLAYSQKNDSIGLSIFSDTSLHMDNYKNYLKLIQEMQNDYGVIMKKRFFSQRELSDTSKIAYSFTTYLFDYKGIKAMKSTSESQMDNGDSIIFLDLRNKGFSEFPKEILSFKYLKYLDLHSEARVEYIDSLSEKERIKLKEEIKKNPDKAYGIE